MGQFFEISNISEKRSIFWDEKRFKQNVQIDIRNLRKKLTQNTLIGGLQKSQHSIKGSTFQK